MKRLTLRLPENLHAALKEIADKEHRSVHAQIVHILEEFIRRYMQAK